MGGRSFNWIERYMCFKIYKFSLLYVHSGQSDTLIDTYLDVAIKALRNDIYKER